MRFVRKRLFGCMGMSPLRDSIGPSNLLRSLILAASIYYWRILLMEPPSLIMFAIYILIGKSKEFSRRILTGYLSRVVCNCFGMKGSCVLSFLTHGGPLKVTGRYGGGLLR